MKGEVLNVEVYGASHASAIGVRLSGLPAGTEIDRAAIDALLARRRAVRAPWSTSRIEKDEYVFLEGVNGCVTDGGTGLAEIKNTDTRSSDYGEFRHVPRPSHADYAAMVKDGIDEVTPGGGRFSGRLTAPLCIAGGIAEGILLKKGVYVCAYVSSIGNVEGRSYKDGVPAREEASRATSDPLPALDKREEMLAEILAAASSGDSVGGTVECVVYGLKAGIGDYMTYGMESAIAASVYGVPAVKGVEFGDGFSLTRMRGSEANDPFAYEDGKIVTLTNRSGGINGGITNGMPLTLRVAIRPTPSIAKKQHSVNVLTRENVILEIKGRHDACIVPRAAAAVESAVALAVLDKILAEEAKQAR